MVARPAPTDAGPSRTQRGPSNAYGWFQLHMVILAYDQQPRSSFQQVINTLPSENYDEH